MPALTTLFPRKRTALQLMIAAVALAAMGCGAFGICGASEPTTLRLTPEATRAATTAATTAPTTAAAASTVAASATRAAASATAAGAGSYSGKIALGYDHPPFMQDWKVTGGNSIAIVCGSLSGAPGGSVIVINLGGGTGQPASVNATLGPDGLFLAPFPIQQYGPLTATVGSVKTSSGTALTGAPLSANLPVAAGADVACKP